MKKLKLSIVCVVIASILLLVSGCKKENNLVAPLEVTFKKEGELRLYNVETDTLVATFDIEIADNEYERQTGLMHRESMEDHQAMLFIFDDVQYRSFFMKNTLFSIDIIYFDENGKLISAVDNATPLDETGLPSRAPAKYVLEVNAGLLEKLGMLIGDRIEYSEL